MGTKRREPSEEPHRELDNWRAYLFIIVLMAKRARAERRGQEGRGGRGPTHLAEELGWYFFFLSLVFVYFTCPPWVGRGAASCLPEHVPSESEGRERAGASRGWVGARIIFLARFNCPKVAR